jgi:biotin transporter BioY
MENFYKIGVVIGIVVIYGFATMGLAALFTITDSDEVMTPVLAWIIGGIAFIALAIFTLTKFNLWGSV